jgi:phosphohistidine phosphatase
MLTFSLLRHAKSSWDDPGLDDHDRPLSPRGESAAAAMGAYLADQKLIPDLILCSDAVRTRETLKRVLPHFGAARPEIVFEPELYLASEATMLAVLQKTKANFRNVLMIGHNPGTQALAMELAANGSRRDIANMGIKFPTCGLAVFTFEGEDWRKIKPAGGRLRLFQTPKRLA